MDNMKNVWQFFHNLDESVYAADIETHELVYLNRKALDTLGLKSLDEVKGKKCYEVLQGLTAPCGICNNDSLSVGQFKSWRYYNSVIDKYFILKDTLLEDPETKRKYRLEITVDITEERVQDELIQTYRDMESLTNACLRKAIAVETPDESINIILEHLGAALSAERTYVFEENENGGDDNTYEWCAPGIHPEKDNLQNLPPEVCANWYSIFEEGHNIIIPDLEETKETDPLQYENLKRQGIHSLVIVPLYDKGKVIGFCGADNPPPIYLEYTHDMLQIAATFLISCIRRRKLLAKLMELSYKDALTKFGNRFALTEYVQQMDRTQSVAVVYCDVTGLKHVNDTQGHEAGDKLILDACECLKQVFDDSCLFRIGGDELLAVCPNITQADADALAAQLREVTKKHSVNLAIGSVRLEAMGNDLFRAIMEAEKLMYADKSEYYRTSGIERRRR